MSTTTPTQTSWKNARIADDVDRISNLPDGVISHVLSNLPIKDAVRTSVLSKYWEFKWTSIYNLHIDHGDHLCDTWGMGLCRNIVDKMLLHLNNIKSFRLVCMSGRLPAEPYAIESWISAVFRRCNIESVELVIYEEEDFVLPRSLLGCTSLRNLSVDILWGCIFNVPAKICFPNLANLVLHSVKIVNGLSGTDTMKFTFPVLGTLTLVHCEWSNVKHVEFFAPSLTSFNTSTQRGDLNGYSIKIIGSRLAAFDASGCFLEKFVLTDTSVVTAILHFSGVGILGELGFQVRKLLSEVSCLQHLDITSNVIKAIAQSKTSLSLPRYSELKKVSVESHTTELDVEGLLEILHSSPFLEILIIDVTGVEYCYDSDDSVQIDVNGYNYDAIESVPSCILSHLKQINFCYPSHYFENSQFHVEKFLLKNALELKNVYVCGDYGCDVLQLEKIVNLFSAFPNGSKCLTIEAKV